MYAREEQRYASDLTDAEWALIEPHMPAAKRLGRPRATELRSVLDAILYIARTGCQWRMLPKEFRRRHLLTGRSAREGERCDGRSPRVISTSEGRGAPSLAPLGSGDHEINLAAAAPQQECRDQSGMGHFGAMTLCHLGGIESQRHAAARAAGFNKGAFPIPADIEGAARVLRKRLSEEDRERMRSCADRARTHRRER
jgi:hypothetical protein